MYSKNAREDEKVSKLVPARPDCLPRNVINVHFYCLSIVSNYGEMYRKKRRKTKKLLLAGALTGCPVSRLPATWLADYLATMLSGNG